MNEIQQQKATQIRQLIKNAFPERNSDQIEKETFIMATAMMNEYMLRHGENEHDHEHGHEHDADGIMLTEMEFAAPIINPVSGRESRSFIMRGKIDAIGQLPDGDFYIMEHKTASRVDAAYIDRLTLDSQIAIYAHYGSQFLTLDKAIKKVIYNVLCKTRRGQNLGETEEEYQIRYADLCSKNKSGKSTAKRQMPETDAEYYERIRMLYSNPETPEKDKLQRLELYIDQFQTDELLKEIWEITQHILLARRAKLWFRNTDACYQWNSRCEYFPLCLAKIPDALIETDYEVVRPHAELSDQPVDRWNGRSALTYSAIRKFRNCRRAYYWRYERGLSPIQDRPALAFGRLIHDCLEIWHSRESASASANENQNMNEESF